MVFGLMVQINNFRIPATDIFSRVKTTVCMTIYVKSRPDFIDLLWKLAVFDV